MIREFRINAMNIMDINVLYLIAYLTARLQITINPPFGTKKGGERPTRDDISFRTSNKQLNFLQVIYRSLKADGKARCAVVLPDNVLFVGGDGTSVRRELMNFCNVHTILRLPTGIFYAQGVKTNVLFFTRGETEKDNTKEIAYYDLRTNQEGFGKTLPLRKSDFDEFMEGYSMLLWRLHKTWGRPKNLFSFSLGLFFIVSIDAYFEVVFFRKSKG